MRNAAIEGHMRAGHWDAALAEAQAGILELPTHAGYHAFVGLCHFRKGDYHKAVDPFKRATILDPGMWQAGFKLAQCYDKMRLYEEAHATAKEFLRVAPNDHGLQGLVLALQPMVTEGRIESWEQTRRLDVVHVPVAAEEGGSDGPQDLPVRPAWGHS
jgi:tetratricopeptide (TPR) repeat protein